MQVPHCAKCGRDHYRFVRHEDVDAWNERHAEKVAKAANPKIQNRSMKPGFHEVITGRIDPLTIQRRSVPKGMHLVGADLPRGQRVPQVPWLKRRHDGPEAA